MFGICLSYKQISEKSSWTYLSKHEVQSLIHYPIPPHLQEAYSDLGYKVGDFPISERLAERVLTLPLYNGMTEEEMDYLIHTINQFKG
jgi:dTDP-4-amino-4,6-dideoxygalactose transaminase